MISWLYIVVVVLVVVFVIVPVAVLLTTATPKTSAFADWVAPPTLEDEENTIALVVRVKNEPYVEEFVRYYVNEGISHIFIFDDMSTVHTEELRRLSTSSLPVTVIQSPLGGPGSINDPPLVHDLYEHVIRPTFDWVINVDVDEFIAPRRTPNSTIRQELETTFANVDCVCIPWVMMAFGGRAKNPASLLEETTTRWNYDNRYAPTSSLEKYDSRSRYDFIEAKSIWRPSAYAQWKVHIPASSRRADKKVSGVDAQPVRLKGSRMPTPRERDISTAHLLCYHFRVYSLEHAASKIDGNRQHTYNRSTLRDVTSNDYSDVFDDTLRVRVQRAHSE